MQGMETRERALIGLVIISIIIATGSILFSFMEGINIFDAFYWTITVLTTVGFGDIVPTTPQAKMLYIALVVSGIAFYGYFVTSIITSISESKLKNILAAYLPGIYMPRKLRNHTIIIGWNRFSEAAYEELENSGRNPVVIVEDEEKARMLSRGGVRVMYGDPADENILKEAGIDGCSSIIITDVNTEKKLIYILKVRKLREDVPVIVLSRKREMRDIYKQAGATRIVDAYDIVGRLLAGSVFEPLASEALYDMAESSKNLDITEARVGVEATIEELERRGVKARIILIERNNERIYTPPYSFRLKPGDKAVLVGQANDIARDLRMLSGGS